MSADLDTIKEVTDKFAGKWKQVRSENLEAFYQEMGLNMILRKLATTVNPTQEIVVNDTQLSVTTKAGFKTLNDVFKLNEEVDITNDKGKFKGFMTYEDGVLKVKMTACEGNDAPPVQSERSINEAGEMEVVAKTEKTTCKRFFARQAN